ncbi:MAG: hydrogenase accessory protein HypB [Clostridiales bacterium]|jgi:hydrogenase nickel incorporation protein HypB|nr:MAG: hydrogenase accessory protein HypB [Clostridiales bacterium]
MEIKVMHQIMEWNEDVSDAVKAELAEHRVCLVNVMGSPGAGKTSMIVELINRLRDRYRIGVIEGDIAGQVDADKIHAMGIPVVQLDTDGACHIEAMSIQQLLKEFSLPDLDVVFVENIGNLVCPAEFNIGENFRVALLSVPEGDDKVVKYPLMFATTDALVLNKYDMRQYFEFDDAKVEADARGVNPNVNVFRVSSRTGDGLDELVEWISKKVNVILGKEKGGV